MKRVEMARNHYIGVCEDAANAWRKKQFICSESATGQRPTRPATGPRPLRPAPIVLALIPWTTLELLHDGFIRNQLFWKSNS